MGASFIDRSHHHANEPPRPSQRSELSSIRALMRSRAGQSQGPLATGSGRKPPAREEPAVSRNLSLSEMVRKRMLQEGEMQKAAIALVTFEHPPCAKLKFRHQPARGPS